MLVPIELWGSMVGVPVAGFFFFLCGGIAPLCFLTGVSASLAVFFLCIFPVAFRLVIVPGFVLLILSFLLSCASFPSHPSRPPACHSPNRILSDLI